MADREDEENQSFRVKDQRRFNPDGSVREGSSEPEKSPPSPSMEGKAADSVAGAAQEADQGNPPPAFEEPPEEGASQALPADFPTLILSLASSAQISLGIVPHPGTGQLEKSILQAKHAIDMLGVLEEKTRGNLSQEEEQLLKAILGDLRMRFVELSKEG